MATSKEVKKSEGTALVLDQRPDWLNDNTARGSEEVNNNDITLPRISIIQDLSPQLKQNKSEYIAGSKVGDMFNTVTNELITGALKVVPIYLQKQWIIWKDRKKGGGFFGAYDSEQEAIRELPKLEGNANDYAIVDTDVHYVLILGDDGKITEAAISMSKSQKKVSRNWNTIIKMAGGDRFSRVYALGTTNEENKNGDEYQNYTIKPIGYVTKEVYTLAETVYEAIRAGARKVDHDERPEQVDLSKAQDAEFTDSFEE